MNIYRSVIHALGLSGYFEYRRQRKLIDAGIRYDNRDLYKNIHNNIIFVHIPKTAGMSFVESLYGSRSSHHAKAIDYQTVNPVKFAEYNSFAITRHPYARLVSAYSYLATGGKEIIDHVWRDKYLRSYKNFEEFVMAGGLERAINENAEHFIPQYKFVTDEKQQVICDHIGKLEYLENTISWLHEQGITISLRLTNKSETKEKIHYTEEMKEMVSRLYEKDFSLFNYKP